MKNSSLGIIILTVAFCVTFLVFNYRISHLEKRINNVEEVIDYM